MRRAPERAARRQPQRAEPTICETLLSPPREAYRVPPRAAALQRASAIPPCLTFFVFLNQRVAGRQCVSGIPKIIAPASLARKAEGQKVRKVRKVRKSEARKHFAVLSIEHGARLLEDEVGGIEAGLAVRHE